MLIQIKGAKPTKHPLKLHMGYDVKNGNAINPNGKYQRCLWMQSMSMLKNEKNMAKLGATLPLRQVTTYERCMKVGVVLTRPTLNKQPQER